MRSITLAGIKWFPCGSFALAKELIWWVFCLTIHGLKSLCCHTRIRWVFSPCFIYLFIYLFLCGPPYHRWRISLHDWNIWNCGCGCSKKSLFTSQSLPSFFSFWNAEVLFTVRISERVVRAVFIAHTVCK